EILAEAAGALISLKEYRKALSAADMLDPAGARGLIMDGVDAKTAGYYAMDYGFAIARLESRMASLQEVVFEGLVAAIAEEADQDCLERGLKASEKATVEEDYDPAASLKRVAQALIPGGEENPPTPAG